MLWRRPVISTSDFGSCSKNPNFASLKSKNNCADSTVPPVAGGVCVTYTGLNNTSPLILTVSASTSPIETSTAPPTEADNSDVPLIS